jgi:hypothetical protein
MMIILSFLRRAKSRRGSLGGLTQGLKRVGKVGMRGIRGKCVIMRMRLIIGLTSISGSWLRRIRRMESRRKRKSSKIWLRGERLLRGG